MASPRREQLMEILRPYKVYEPLEFKYGQVLRVLAVPCLRLRTQRLGIEETYALAQLVDFLLHTGDFFVIFLL